MGVPVKLGAAGIEEVVELDLSDAEQAELQASAALPCAEVVAVLDTRFSPHPTPALSGATPH